MGIFRNHFVEVKKGTKITYSDSDLRKLDRNYEKEALPAEEKRILSAFRKVPEQAYLTQVRDYAFEKILDNQLYTFQHILVIPNPYDLVKQSALLLFNSSKKAKVRYRVIGDTPEADFTGETEYARRHRVPILGLYQGRNNKVELEMLDTDGVVVKRRMLRIYVSEVARREEEAIGENINKKLSQFPFILVNGHTFDPVVVDCNGAIRYSIQLRSKRVGMIPLANGHFLYEDRTANRMNEDGSFSPCRYHEMDYMGRVYRTYLVNFPVTGVAASTKDTLFLYMDFRDEDDGERRVAGLNLQTGEAVLDCVLPHSEENCFRGRLCRPLREGRKKRWIHAVLSEDGTELTCTKSDKSKKKKARSCLVVKEGGTGEVLRTLYIKKSVSMMWPFEPDVLEFSVPVKPIGKVLYGKLTPPERFRGELPPEAEEKLEKIYFGGIYTCGELFISRILPGRVDRVYFVGEEHIYVQDYERMKIGNAKVFFAISMAELAADEYYIFVESRGVIHRLKNRIRVV